MSKETKKRQPTPSATVMLCRDYQGKLEVLMVRRNIKLAFAGGLWVFPGGKIDSEELAQAPNEQAAANKAAVRELEEETSVKITPDDLKFFRHWTTPITEPRRFATWFFYAKLSNSQAVIIDDGEIKDYQWINPADALEKLDRGELPMINPTILSLMLIKDCSTCIEAADIIDKLIPIFILPILIYKETSIVALYEGDAGYASGDPALTGPRHRFTVDLKQKKYFFEYEGCNDIEPVTIL